MAKVVIAELDIDIQALLKTTSDLKKEIDKLKNSQKELAASGEGASEAFIENEAVLKSLNSAYAQNIKAIQETNKATTQQTDQTELLNLALTQEATSISEAREQNKLLNKLRNETNVSTKEGQAQLTALNAKLDQNNEFIKKNGDAYLKQKINIGNYKEDIKSALGELNLFNGGLQQFGTAGKVAEIGFKLIGDQAKAIKNSFTEAVTANKQVVGGMQNLSNSTGDAQKSTIGFVVAQKAKAAATTVSTTAMAGASAALKIFRLALISTGIGAVVVALGSLITFLATSKEGIDAVTAVTRPLQAIFSSLIGVVQNVGSSLLNAFKNPKKALSDLADFVKQNLINRFTAFGTILKGIIELDFKKVTNGVLQAGTGVVNLTDKISKAAGATGKFLEESAKKGAEIDKLQKQIEKNEIAYQRAQIKTQDLIDQQLLISKDTSKSFAERAKASNEIIRLTGQLSKQEEGIIQSKIKVLKLEQSMRGAKSLTISDQQLQVDLEKQLDEAQDRALNARLEQTKVLSGLKKEQQSIDKANGENAAKLAEQELEKQKKIAEEKIAYAKAELDLFLATEKSKLDGAKELTDELVKEEERRLLEIQKRKLAQLAKEKGVDAAKIEEKKLNNEELTQAEIEFETQRVLLADETDKAIQTNKENLNAQVEAKRIEKEAIDLQNKLALSENEFTRVQADLDRNYQAEIEAAKKSGADISLINAKYADYQKQIDTDLTNFKLEAYQKTFNMIAGMFGKNTLLSKAAALAEVGITTYQKAFESFSQAKVFFSNPLTAPLGVNAAIQGGLTIAQGVATAAKISGVKFEQGGIQEVGGKRHSQGGTKFYGEDGTMFEAEKGEGIGILNRGAYDTFLNFNNTFGKGKSSSGLFQGGGIITQGVKPQTQDLVIIADAIASMPAPVVAVEEIQTVGNRFIKVKANADF